MSQAPSVLRKTATAIAAAAVVATALTGWVHVFQAGQQVDSAGRVQTFTAADLDQMVANHTLGAAPAVLGHPKHNDPAYAWVDGYKRDGDSLYAKFTDINPDFAAGVQSGAYRNKSLSLVKDHAHGWRVRHVGWLGAVPPAIDGLSNKPADFSKTDEACFEFAAPGYSLVWGMESIAKLLRGLREQMIAKDGIEAADAALPQWQIDSALESATQARKEFQDERGTPLSLFLKPKGETMTTFTQEQLDVATAEAATAATAAAESKSKVEFAASQAELLKLRTERQNETIAAQIGGWKAAGKVTPAEEPGLAEFMASLENTTGVELNFSASDKTEVKKTPSQFFSEFMAGRKPVVKLGADPVPNESALDLTNPADVSKAASDFMAAEAKEGRTVNAASAVQHVMTVAAGAR